MSTDENVTKKEQGEAVIRRLNEGRPQPALEDLRSRFPLLAHGIESYALGTVWAETELDDRTRQIATVAAFAALGEIQTLEIHVRYALNIGVTPAELIDLVALTTVHAGFPRAIEAAETIGRILDERAQVDEPDEESERAR